MNGLAQRSAAQHIPKRTISTLVSGWSRTCGGCTGYAIPLLVSRSARTGVGVMRPLLSTVLFVRFWSDVITGSDPKGVPPVCVGSDPRTYGGVCWLQFQAPKPPATISRSNTTFQNCNLAATGSISTALGGTGNQGFSTTQRSYGCSPLVEGMVHDSLKIGQTVFALVVALALICPSMAATALTVVDPRVNILPSQDKRGEKPTPSSGVAVASSMQGPSAPG